MAAPSSWTKSETISCTFCSSAGGSGAPPGINVGSIQQDDSLGAQLSARSQQVQQDLAQNLGNLSARAGAFFSKMGSEINKAAEFIPTQQNKETRAARQIQTAWRSCAARGHFHEERGAVLMLQSAQRRVKAQKAAAYKKALKYWAATVIQERYRRHKLRQKAKEVQAAKATEAANEITPKKAGGLGSKIVKSLSFSRRKGTKQIVKPEMPSDLAPEDLVSARGNNPQPAMLLGTPQTPSGGAVPTGGAQPKKRSLSFTRRKKADAAPPSQQV